MNATTVNTNKSDKRGQWFIDRKLQGAMIWRVFVYWLSCMFVMTVLLIAWRMAFSGPARGFLTHFDDLWFHYSPAVVVSLFIIPLLVVDVLRFSNRFAGPVFRLRRELKRLADGEAVRPVHFRKGDFWHELAEDFNRVASQLEELRRSSASSKTRGAEEESEEDNLVTSA
ncbi:MAG: hypothetical protein HYS13_11785 [Planctomycetia bacterium]|nr:hypothetical protein [Planctomycetia bacterium]